MGQQEQRRVTTSKYDTTAIILQYVITDVTESHSVEVPGGDVCIPMHILFVPRILSRESETRTLNCTSTSTDYQKKLQLFRYKVLINLSCHDGDSMMINFGQLTLPRHHVCEMLNNLFNRVCKSRSWNFLCSQHLEIKLATVRVKIRCFISVDECLYHCWCDVPALFKSNDPTSLDPGLIRVVRVHAKWTAK